MTTNANRFAIQHPSEAQLVLAMDRELGQQEAAAIVRHLNGCDICRTRWRHFGEVSEQIVECHRALGSGRLCVPNAAIALRPRSSKIARAAGFVGAAAALALVALQLMRVDGPAQLMHRAEGRLVGAAPVRKNSSVATTLPNVRRASRRKPTRLVAADMSNIIELPFSDRALPLGDATVVRVELPIEELRLTGLMVDGGRAGTIIQAEVLMGIDGLPRAIRLVQ